jgi:hypothetical protein
MHPGPSIRLQVLGLGGEGFSEFLGLGYVRKQDEMMHPMGVLDFYGESEKRVAQKEEPVLFLKLFYGIKPLRK